MPFGSLIAIRSMLQALAFPSTHTREALLNSTGYFPAALFASISARNSWQPFSNIQAQLRAACGIGVIVYSPAASILLSASRKA